MEIKINVTPEDLKNVYSDLEFNRLNCKNVLQQIILKSEVAIEPNLEELEMLKNVIDENQLSERKKNGRKEN